MTIAGGLLAMLTFALGAALLALVVHAYHVHQIAALIGSDDLSYRTTVHTETKHFLNGQRLAQGGATLVGYATDEVARNLGEVIQIRSQQGNTILVGVLPIDPTKPIGSSVTNPHIAQLKDRLPEKCAPPPPHAVTSPRRRRIQRRSRTISTRETAPISAPKKNDISPT